jgi:trimethylamine-N-oxide reductase (cytochrome c)
MPDKEKTIVKGLSFGGVTEDANAAQVDVKNGKIIRIRPLHFDSKYKPEEFKPWKIEARGQVFKPTMKTLLPPFSLAYKNRVYSPNRTMYPLKRVDWNPDGERNPQNRGKSRYVRISWDEATDIVASELRRIQKKYGTTAVLARPMDTERRRLSMPPTGAAGGCWRLWVVTLGKPGIQIAVRGGTGAPNMSGDVNR